MVNFVSRSQLGLRLYLKLAHKAGVPDGSPEMQRRNGTLKERREWQEAQALVRRLGLVSHPDPPKNWDSMVALASILAETDPSASILDAGAELYSPLLPSLFLYGYRKLFGINLSFSKPVQRGPIRYEPGNLTKTQYKAATFDAITCLSVIEHGVDLARYFEEMSRILKPGGILVTSTDYWPAAADTHGAVAYGAPVKIFSEQQILSMVQLSSTYGFEPTGPIDLTAHERAVSWKRFGLEFTFIVFCLRKNNRA